MSLPARFAVAAVVLATTLYAQAPTADSILADAEAQAQANQRAVYVIFHASW